MAGASVTTPLFDSPGHTRGLERAMAAMWELRCRARHESGGGGARLAVVVHAGAAAALPAAAAAARVAALLRDAVRAFEGGDVVGAEAVAARVLAAHPRLPDALYLVGMVREARGEPDAAADLVRAAIEGLPSAELCGAPACGRPASDIICTWCGVDATPWRVALARLQA